MDPARPGAGGSSLTEFHLFSKLPKNLRCRIWKMALPYPRRYTVLFFGPNDAAYELRDWTPPPACLMVNQEARTQGLRWFKKIPLFHDDYDRESEDEENWYGSYEAGQNENGGKEKRRTAENSEERAVIQGKYLGQNIPECKRFVYINFGLDWIDIQRKTQYYLSERPFAIWEWSERLENLGVDWTVWASSIDPLDCIIRTFPAIRNVWVIGKGTSQPFPLQAQHILCTRCGIGSGWILDGKLIRDKTEMTRSESVAHPDRQLKVTVKGIFWAENRGVQLQVLHIELK